MSKFKTKRWLVLTPGRTLQASTKFRITQLQSSMAERGHKLEILPAIKAKELKCHGYDGVIIQKVLPKRELYLQLKALQLPTVFDLDDAVWIGSTPQKWIHRLRRIIKTRNLGRLCTAITASNRTLGNYFRSQKVRIVPMALDAKLWPARQQWDESITLGWAGAPGNLGMIEQLDPVLRRVLAGFPQVKLKVFSGEQPKLSCPHQFVEFSDEKLPEVIRSFSIGLVPLYNNQFSAAKSPIKALQYMASAIPFVGTPQPGLTEMTSTIPAATFADTPQQWEQAIRDLVRRSYQLAELGMSGRQRFEQHFTLDSVVKQFDQVLTQTYQDYHSKHETRNSPAACWCS